MMISKKHALILVMGGDMRDLSQWSNAASQPWKERGGLCLYPRFQKMRPLGPFRIDAKWLADTEILAIVDRFDAQVEVQHIHAPSGAVKNDPVVSAIEPAKESPADLLPWALEITEDVPHRAVVFWGHGSGIFGGLLGDAHPDPDRSTWLPLHDAAALLQQGLNDGAKVDLIAVVGCFAGMVETLHAFAPYAHTFAGFANRMDPRFFHLGSFIEAMTKSCSCADDHEHWARAARAATQEGYGEFRGKPEYGFARCAASAWRTGPFADAVEEKEPLVREINKAWPGVLERAGQVAHRYDDLDSVDIADLVYRVWEHGDGNGAAAGDFNEIWNRKKGDPYVATNPNELTNACEDFLASMREAQIWREIGPALKDSQQALGVWFPGRNGKAIHAVAETYRCLEERCEEEERPDAQKSFSTWRELQLSRFGLVQERDRRGQSWDEERQRIAGLLTSFFAEWDRLDPALKDLVVREWQATEGSRAGDGGDGPRAGTAAPSGRRPTREIEHS